MATSFKKTYANTVVFSAPTPWQPTVNPCLHQRLLNTHKQVWLSLLWGHYYCHLGPGVHKLFWCLPRVCFPRVLGDALYGSYVSLVNFKVLQRKGMQFYVNKEILSWAVSAGIP